MKKNIKLKTRRLIIRPYKLSDFNSWKFAHSNNLSIKSKFDMANRPSPTLTRTGFKKMYLKYNELWKQDSTYCFAVFLKQNNQLVGQVLLMDLSRHMFQNAYLGYFLFNNHWNNGYVYEASQALIKWGFKDLNLHRIEAAISSLNRKSIKLAKKLKMRKKGISKKRLYVKKKWKDFVIYALTSEDYGIKWKSPSK